MSLDVASQLTLALSERLGNQIAKGRAQAKENQFLNELLPQIQQAGQDPEALIQTLLKGALSGQISPEKQQVLNQFLGPLSQLSGKKQAQTQKLQQQQQEEQQRLSTVDLAAQVSGLNKEDLQGLPQASLNTIIRENIRQKDVLSPNEQAFEQLQKPILENVPKINANLSSSNRLLTLATEGNFGIDFENESSLNKIRSAARLIGVDLPLTADEAQAQNLILQKADELKQKFGARVTNFDFEKWLEGQPDKRKFRNANIAVALMQKASAEIDKQMFDTWQSIVNDPRTPPEQRVNALLQKQSEIIENQDKKLNNQLAQLKKNPGKKFQPDAILFEDDQGAQFVVPKDQAVEFQRRAREQQINMRIVQ